MVEEILRRKRAIIERLKERRSIKRAISMANKEGKRPVIAEIKRRGLKVGEEGLDIEAAVAAKRMEDGGACAISVLTEEAFAGSLSDLKAVKLYVALPVLRKDFIFDEFQIAESYVHGADAILLIARFLSEGRLKELAKEASSLGLETLIEIDRVSKGLIPDTDLTEISASTLIGINNRELDTLEVNVAIFEEIAPEIKPALPADVPLVAMSGISGEEEARRMFKAGADALLAGTSIMRAGDMTRKVREFVWCRGSPLVGGDEGGEEEAIEK